ncbi:Serine/threonine-protein kinase OSR1 like [Verticillium longisporum]|uniref:Serine/threonine-protein kinase OSR1 like n=1 Tax=Verticillium longisporum TaxID=100787 RepID=A0A8I3AGP0_VERLO|nr:Serine/threonine-protein kinase OSR1 like [Verticillium longisporum]
MSDTKRHTRFIEAPSAVVVGGVVTGLNTNHGTPHPTLVDGEVGKAPKAEEKPPPLHTRFQIKPASESHEPKPLPLIAGSPWKHYDAHYRIKLGYSFGVVTPRDGPCLPRMIRAITGPNSEEHIQRFHQLCHPNIVKAMEAYDCPVDGSFLVSEFMLTFLRHLCQAPIYPNEPQLSSILHQVLSGLDFLLKNDLVHEEVSVGNVLINSDGSVKICDMDRCQRAGDAAKLLDSFSRLQMRLMDKEKDESDTIGLTRLGNWSDEALDMFTNAISGSAVKELLGHPFMNKRDQAQLMWLVPYVSMTAFHSTD